MVQSEAKSLQDVRDAAFGIGFRRFTTVPGDGSNLDSFSRTRVSANDTVFETKPQWDNNPLMWDTLLVGTATAVFVFNEDTIKLEVPNAGDRVVRQSHGHIPYQPGKSQQIFLTGRLPDRPVNAVGRCGYFEDNDGIFCETRESGVGWTLRSSVSGSVVDTFIPQEEWNIDTLIPNRSGTRTASNPSGIRLDMSKTQVFVIDFQWLGVGRVRCGFDIDGTVVYVHEFLNANMIDTIYMQTGSLPVRFELLATGGVPSVSAFKQICASVISEGGSLNLRGLEFSAGNGATLRSITGGNKLPVCSIRTALLFKASLNRIPIDPESFLAITAGGGIFWEVVLNPTTLTDADFGPVDGNSSMEIDTSATAVAGGTVIRSGYLTAAGPGASASGSDGPRLMGDLRMALDILGTGRDVLTFAATALANTDVGAQANWREHQ